MEPNQIITTQDEDGEFLTPDEDVEQELDAMIDRMVDENEKSTAALAEWDESKHHRGQPGNAGEFGPGGGGAKKDAPEKKAEPAKKASGSDSRTTEEIHRTNGGEYTLERQKIHDAYTQQAIAGIPRSESPTVYMTGGGPASGKTTGILNNPRAGIPDKTKAAHINPDDAKEHIPEYVSGLKSGDKGAAARTHEESSHMSKVATRAAAQSGHDIVLDTVGDSGIKNLSAKVAGMRAAGAKKIVAHYATVDIGQAIAQSDKRAERTGRYVPHEYIKAAHQDVSRTVQDAIKSGLFDALDLWDTSAKGNPIHVASHTKGGELVIHDPKAWEAFKARGA